MKNVVYRKALILSTPNGGIPLQPKLPQILAES